MHSIGIDGGGTKTVGILTAATGERIARTEAGPSNYHVVGEEKTQEVLATVIANLFEQAGLPPTSDTAFCLGMAGLGRAEDRGVIGRICDALGVRKNRILTHDAHIALVGGIGKPEGVIIISGTGSIVYGINAHGEEARAGGWGYLLGDEGSGYDIALKGLQAVARAADGRTEPTALTALVLEKLGLDTPGELIRWTHAASRDVIAQLAEVIFRAAERGDRSARQIVTTAADELACAASVVLKRLAFTEPPHIVLSGGNLVHQPLFVEELRSRLTAPVMLPKHEPAVGAMLLAREKLGR